MYISKTYELSKSSFSFDFQLVGAADVASARGDSMCAEAIKKLKVNVLLLNHRLFANQTPY